MKEFKFVLLNKNFFCLVILFVFLRMMVPQASADQTPVQESSGSELVFNKDDRIIVLAPHPDDEILGCAGILQKAQERNIPIQIVFLTYGDANEWAFLIDRKHPVVVPRAVESMGLVRSNEAIKAAGYLGLRPQQVIFLGYPDFGTLNIWYQHWNDRHRYHSLLTKVDAVPYPNAFRFGAAYKGEEVLRDLETILRDFKPTKIFVSHPADHNGDHNAFYLFMRVALWDLQDLINPEIYPYLVHFVPWAKKKGYYPLEEMEPPARLKEKIAWKIDSLSEEEVLRKREALKQHATQYRSSQKYLESFVRADELFGEFPILKISEDATIHELAIKQEDNDGYPAKEVLTEEERNLFVGLEEQTLSLEGANLNFHFKLSRPLGKTVGLSLCIFGYKENYSFERMPKLRIKIGAIFHQIFDQNKKIPGQGIKIKRKLKQITISIPMDLLGNPDKILTSAHTYLGSLLSDYPVWRVVEILP